MSVKIAISTGSCAAHHGGHEVLDARRTDLLHGGVKLEAHQLEHTFDARLPECAEPPDVRPADAHRARAQTQRLHHVGAAAEAGIDEDWHAAANCVDNLRQRVDGGAAGILAARA